MFGVVAIGACHLRHCPADDEGRHHRHAGRQGIGAAGALATVAAGAAPRARYRISGAK